MKYISLFSGVGGLEASISPIAVSDIDPSCQRVLRKIYPDVTLCDNILNFPDIKADVVAGGWPCQDISVAGTQKGLKGKNSVLFYHMIQIAVTANAHTIIAENVRNLLLLHNGQVFNEVINEFRRHGYRYISWRILNARQFNLPQNRYRVLLVASKCEAYTDQLLCDISERIEIIQSPKCSGFYWTGGTHSLNYHPGYVPPIKRGSSLGIPSAPAVHYHDIVRSITPDECIKLQGFNKSHFDDIPDAQILSLMGNAVPRPMGKFVMDAIINCASESDISTVLSKHLSISYKIKDHFNIHQRQIAPCGKITESEYLPIVPSNNLYCNNLDLFINLENTETISKKAAQGLVRRIEKSQTACPPSLMRCLIHISES